MRDDLDEPLSLPLKKLVDCLEAVIGSEPIQPDSRVVDRLLEIERDAATVEEAPGTLSLVQATRDFMLWYEAFVVKRRC